MTFVITRSCCNDASCVAVCPVNCIHPTPDEPGYGKAEMLYIDPVGCIDCGACVPECPVDAIVSDMELTPETTPFADLNREYYTVPAHRDYPPPSNVRPKPAVPVEERRKLRVAIVGSGPAACYAADCLVKNRDVAAEVTMFEKLPTPWGLVRYGVAPDHQDTKGVISQFKRTVANPAVELHLNVEVGKHVSHQDLLDSHHAVIYAVGASVDRRLGVPGEDLPGSHSATDFVAWYNGHPSQVDREFDLSHERAVIIGNGNVALDVARVLTMSAAELTKSDIAPHALEALKKSAVREVVVVARRGLAEAAFSTPELLSLLDRSDVDLVVEDREVAASAQGLPVMTAKKLEVLTKAAARPAGESQRRIRLEFLRTPSEIVGAEKVEGVRFFVNEPDLEGGYRTTDEVELLDCGLVFRAVGYRGQPIEALPFDDRAGILPNDSGRVVDPVDGQPVRVHTRLAGSSADRPG